MGGELREIRVVVTTTDSQHWHPGWLRAADAERATSYHDWLMGELGDAIKEAVAGFVKKHPDEFACNPDVIA